LALHEIYSGVLYNAIPYTPFGTAKIPAERRIGPHNIDVISVLVGNLLGNAHGELQANSPRFSLHMSEKNREYLGW